MQDYGNADVIVLMIASAALFLLVVGRMAGLVRQEERAASRELALRNAGGQLVAAAGQEQIYDAAISAVQRLLGAEAGVRLALVSATGPMVVAATDGGEDRPIADATWGWLDATAVPSGRSLWRRARQRCRGELGFPPGDFLLVLPLSTRDEVRGHLVICSRGVASPELLDSLEASPRRSRSPSRPRR